MTGKYVRFVFGLCAAALSLPAVAQEAEQKVTRTWAMAEFGEPLYGPDMRHWPYANPDAPKGGSVVLGAFGSFDSLNTYILRGQWPAGIGLIGDSSTSWGIRPSSCWRARMPARMAS